MQPSAVQIVGGGAVAPNKRVVGIYHRDRSWDPMVRDPFTTSRIRQFDAGQYDVAYNKAICRWQLVAAHEGQLRLVRNWESETGGYLPLNEKLYEWLVATDFSRAYGTRDPRKIAAKMLSEEQSAEYEREVRLIDDLKAFDREHRIIGNRVKEFR